MTVLIMSSCLLSYKMFHIKQIIPRVIKGLKEGKNLDEITIYKESEKILKKNTPDAEVFFYKDKNLYIKCPNPVIANEIFLNQEEIIERINDRLNKKIVNKLIIKIK